jgi:hypothetical protein
MEFVSNEKYQFGRSSVVIFFVVTTFKQ